MQNSEQNQSFFDRAKATAAVGITGLLHKWEERLLKAAGIAVTKYDIMRVSGFLAGGTLLILPTFFSPAQ